MLKKFTIFFLSLLTLVLAPHSVLAVCPVCTVAVGAGLGLSRYIGVDDTVAGVWVGGLILSTSFWLVNWLSKKGFKFPYLKIIVVVLMYILTLLPLRWTGFIGHPLNSLWGVDKLLIGTTGGSIIFLTALWADKMVRKVKGKQLFYYQKVIFPLFGLVLTSLIFYIYTR